jgi:antitoxin PrlF
MSDDTAIFTGAVTTTGRSEALRFEKAFFRANPEFRQQAKVTAKIIGHGHVLVAVEDRPSAASERDPVVSAFLAFLERDMLSKPSGLAPPSGCQADELKVLLEGVAVSDDEGLPDDVTF